MRYSCLAFLAGFDFGLRALDSAKIDGVIQSTMHGEKYRRGLHPATFAQADSDPVICKIATSIGGHRETLELKSYGGWKSRQPPNKKALRELL
jgi:hypothetical protein